MLEKSTLASQPSLSRFWDRISESPDALLQLQALNQAMLDKVRIQRNATELVLDLDSTYSDTYGDQEETAFNRHYQTTGYHPLVAFDGLTKDFLKAELRSGNTYCSTGAADFLNPLLEHYIRPFQSASFLSAQIVALQRRNCMTSVKKKSISTSFGSNGMPACISSRNSLFKLGMRPNGVRRKSISTPFATKPALGSMIVGFAFVLSGKQMN